MRSFSHNCPVVLLKKLTMVNWKVRTENTTYLITPHKASTKVRIVFDASVKASKYVKGLNECLYRGPINLPDMCGILLRFRIYYIVILGDIEKAFLQIGIKEQERDVARFLWFKDPNKPQIVEGNLCIIFFFAGFHLV